nr:phage/plasmid replication protein, II/X family [uncultured Moraxella sp.]
MLDHLRLAVPVFATYAKQLGHTHYLNLDLLDLGLPCATRMVTKDEDGNISTGDLYSPFEKLPSDFTDMAVKFYNSATNTLPYLELKASPLKLLQGHNVFGFEDIELGAIEMLGMITQAYPKLCAILDFEKTEVLHLDTTYFCRLPHQNQVQPVLNYMSNIQSGHRKSKAIKYENYIAWSENSRYINAKAYGKFLELQSQMAKIQKKADKGDARSKQLIYAMHNVMKFSNACLRFEARIHKTYLTKNGYPSNLWQLINLQRQCPELLQNLWQVAFEPILNTLKGTDMTLKDDDKIIDILRDKLKTVTPTGKTSYTKADNAYKFYVLLRERGWEQVKGNKAKGIVGLYKENNFYKQLNVLLDVGLSKASLQNLHIQKQGKVIPFVQLVEIKFNEQLPTDYIKPTSKYMNDFQLVA